MKKELMEGQKFFFNNNRWCDENMSDDMRGGTAMFNDRFGLFCIEFNGSFIHTSKTFSSFKKRLDKLFDDWSLEFTDDEF